MPQITSMYDAKEAARKISADLRVIGHELHNLGQDEAADKVAKYRSRFAQLAEDMKEEFDFPQDTDT